MHKLDSIKLIKTITRKKKQNNETIKKLNIKRNYFSSVSIGTRNGMISFTFCIHVHFK